MKNSSNIANSPNQTIPNSTSQGSEGKIVAWCLAYAVIGIITILSNSLSIAVFMRKNFQRKKLHYILVNLAITDLTVGAIAVPLAMIVINDLIYNNHNQRFVRVYRSLLFFDVLSGLTSIYSIAFISVERLLAVCWPWKHQLLKRWHYALAISLTWLISGTMALVSILPDHVSDLDSLNARTVFYLIPVVVTIASYCSLWYIRKEREIKNRDDSYSKSITCTLLIVTVVFLCTWSPFLLFSSIIWYVGLQYLEQCCSLTYNGFLFGLFSTKLLQYSNSCVNPFIYALKIRSFRATALEILCSFKIVGPRDLNANTSSRAGDTELRSFSERNASFKTEGGTNKTDRASDEKL